MTNRHFGRISEVWKHLVLAEVLAAERPRAVLDTHAGDALYPVIDDPERRFGVLRFMDIVDQDSDLRCAAYSRVLSTRRGESTIEGIPGGPLVAMLVLGNATDYLFCDLDKDSTTNTRDVARWIDVRSARVLTADGMGSVHDALADHDPQDVVVFIDPFDHHAVGPSGLSALDVALEVALAGAILVYWYGYNRVDRRHWIVDEVFDRDPTLQWWCGDLMVSAEHADMTTGDLGVASSPGTGSGLVCINASLATIECCAALGSALEAAYHDVPLPSGQTGRLDFLGMQRS